VFVSIRDAEADQANLRMMWAPLGGSFVDATPVAGQSSVQLPTTTSGQITRFIWDSRTDIGDQNLTVTLAAVASDRGGAGPLALGPAVSVRNRLRIEHVASGEPGETIEVRGRGFGTDASAVEVQFSSVLQVLRPVDVSGEVLHVTVPEGVTAGTLSIRVGGDSSNPAPFVPRADPWFVTGPPAPAGSTAVPPVAADVDGDGRIDLVQGTVLRNVGGGVWTPLGPRFADALALAADLDGDGRCDMVTLPPGRGGEILHQNSDGSFSASALDDTASGSKPAAAFLDLYEDGLPDVVAVRATPSGTARLWQNVGGVFMAHEDRALGLVPASDIVAAADFDGDGRDDLVFGRADGATFLGALGNGVFAARSDAFGSQGTTAGLLAIAGDVDGDGLPDLITAAPFATWRALAAGGFVAQPLQVAVDPRYAVLADVNNDGRLDLYAVTPGQALLYVATPGGLVEQAAAAGLLAPASPLGALAADFDGDGRLDLYDGEHIYWNRTHVGNGHVEVSLSGRWAGARAILTTPDGARQIRWPQSSALPIHFGVGAAPQAQLEIDWASGKKTQRAVAPGDHIFLTSP
jgi:hypothetical protein